MMQGVSDARRAYDRTAPFYDAFTRDHDYDGWTAELEDLAREHQPGLPGPGDHTPRLLDVGCGTGKSFQPFVRRGWDVVGCDLSGAMLAEARRKAPGVPLHRADMRELPRVGSFDLVCCLDDGLNYLPTGRDLASAFRSMARNLSADGLILFDVNTLRTYRTFFAAELRQDHGDLTLLWRGRSRGRCEPGGSARATFAALHRSAAGSHQWAVARHQQRHHPLDTVRHALAAAGLELVASRGMGFDGLTDARPDELDHTKRVHVARHVRRGGEHPC